MPGSHYLPDEEPDLEDFFSQLVPPRLPTDQAAWSSWLHSTRRSTSGSSTSDGEIGWRVEGTQRELREWAQVQDVAERWIFITERSGYVAMLD